MKPFRKQKKPCALLCWELSENRWNSVLLFCGGSRCFFGMNWAGEGSPNKTQRGWWVETTTRTQLLELWCRSSKNLFFPQRKTGPCHESSRLWGQIMSTPHCPPTARMGKNWEMASERIRWAKNSQLVSLAIRSTLHWSLLERSVFFFSNLSHLHL